MLTFSHIPFVGSVSCVPLGVPPGLGLIGFFNSSSMRHTLLATEMSPLRLTITKRFEQKYKAGCGPKLTQYEFINHKLHLNIVQKYGNMAYFLLER